MPKLQLTDQHKTSLGRLSISPWEQRGLGSPRCGARVRVLAEDQWQHHLQAPEVLKGREAACLAILLFSTLVFFSDKQFRL